MRESEWQQQIIDLGRLNGWKIAHFRSVQQQRADGSVFYSTPVAADGAGFPDLIMLRDGEQIVVECKVGRNKLTEAQADWLHEFWRIRCGGIYVWYPKDWDEAVKVLGRERTMRGVLE